MKYLLTGLEMARADANTSQVIGIPSIVLMERAALAVAEEITERFPLSCGYVNVEISSMCQKLG